MTTDNRSDSHSSGHFSVHFPSNRGIATPVCALVRNDSVFERTLTNTNLSHSGFRPAGANQKILVNSSEYGIISP